MEHEHCTCFHNMPWTAFERHNPGDCSNSQVKCRICWEMQNPTMPYVCPCGKVSKLKSAPHSHTCCCDVCMGDEYGGCEPTNPIFYIFHNTTGEVAEIMDFEDFFINSTDEEKAGFIEDNRKKQQEKIELYFEMNQ